jgi:hypothetical protein
LHYPEDLPLVANKASARSTSLIIDGLGDLADFTAFPPLSPRDTKDDVRGLDYCANDLMPFRRWKKRETEDDVGEDLRIRLFDLILQQDILPWLPLDIDPEIDDDIAEAAAYRLFNDRLAFGRLTELSAESLISMEKNYVPQMLTPESLVWDILWSDVFPKMPLRSTNRVAQRDLLRIYGIVVDEYARTEDPDSTDDLSDDDVSPYKMTDKSSGRYAPRSRDFFSSDNDEVEEEEEGEEDALADEYSELFATD